MSEAPLSFFSQRACVSLVFSEVAVDLDPRVLADAVLSYVWALHRKSLSISDILAQTAATALLAAGERRELAQLLQFKVLPDSAAVAELLLSDAVFEQLEADSKQHKKLPLPKKQASPLNNNEASDASSSTTLDRLAFDTFYRLRRPRDLGRALAEKGHLHDAIRFSDRAALHDKSYVLELAACFARWAADSNVARPPLTPSSNVSNDGSEDDLDLEGDNTHILKAREACLRAFQLALHDLPGVVALFEDMRAVFNDLCKEEDHHRQHSRTKSLGLTEKIGDDLVQETKVDPSQSEEVFFLQDLGVKTQDDDLTDEDEA